MAPTGPSPRGVVAARDWHRATHFCQDFLTCESGCAPTFFQTAPTAALKGLVDDGLPKRKSSEGVMISYLSERENYVEQINAICLRLFDTWCETRNVTPLAYLMHCWPMTDSGPAAIRRLGETMRELRRNHTKACDAHGFQALCEMADLIDELVGRQAGTVKLIAVGQARSSAAG